MANDSSKDHFHENADTSNCFGDQPTTTFEGNKPRYECDPDDAVLMNEVGNAEQDMSDLSHVQASPGSTQTFHGVTLGNLDATNESAGHKDGDDFPPDSTDSIFNDQGKSQ